MTQTDDLQYSVKKAEETTVFPDIFFILMNAYHYCLKHLRSTLKSDFSFFNKE